MQDPALVPVKSETAERIHWALNQAFAQLPFVTPLGRVVAVDELEFGFPAGDHRPARFWRFEPATGTTFFHFGFVPNFSWDDLMCKVSPRGRLPEKGAGASIQLNGLKSFSEEGNGFSVSHSGAVTLRQPLSREMLAAEVSKLVPSVAARFGGLKGRWWPLRLGHSSAIPELIDSLYLWSFGVEVVKRAFRGEALLAL